MTDTTPRRSLGCCYYPEQWPRSLWADDARRMAETGLTWVRIGEFAWSKLEPSPGEMHFEWLDEAIWSLGDAGLKVVLGTPTATPPRWMLERHPDMLAVDAMGHPRKFGSRRHYCFSHAGIAAESDRIVTLLAERYGRNEHVAAWQTDNEYGCHDTTISYSDAARTAFRLWLKDRYADIDALNTAWGNVFWSMEYRDFDEIDLPNLTVTEPNPAHALAFRRFSSDQVVAFNRRQVEIIRARSNAPITHNYMGRITDFDHFAVGRDLDFAAWDSYPLGFLEDRAGATPERQRAFARQGDPDFQALHHDLYRAVGRGRMWVMEQQPGPVNWAPHNPAPLPGMVRLWSWEAFAHGAECVSYFRWRQAPFAQEQLHAGLLRPDSQPAPGLEEAAQVAREIAQAPDVAPVRAEAAILFDYDADAAWAVQPHGAGLSYFGLVLDLYKAMRGLGLSIDILPASTRDFTGYRLIAAPGLMHMPGDLKSALAHADAEVLIGPRSGARDAEFTIPVPLPPAFPGLDVTVTHVESLRDDAPEPLDQGGAFIGYREALEGAARIVERTALGAPALMREDRVSYLGGWPDPVAARRIIAGLCTRAGLDTIELPDGIRRRDTGTERFWFNHTEQAAQIDDLELPPISVTRQPL